MKSRLKDTVDVEERIEWLRLEETDLAQQRIALEDERDAGIALIKAFEVSHDNRTFDVDVKIEPDGQRHYDYDEDLAVLVDIDDVFALVDEEGE